MAVGMTHVAAVNDWIARDPRAALKLTEELLAAGAVTLGGIGAALGIRKSMDKTQLLEVELLDEAAHPRFFEHAVGNVRHALLHFAKPRLRWHPGAFRNEYAKGTSDVSTPVLVHGQLLDDREAIAMALGLDAGVWPRR